jgi:hypothetical protein
MRPPRPRFDGIEPTFSVSGKEPVEVATTDAALGCRGGDGQLR